MFKRPYITLEAEAEKTDNGLCAKACMIRFSSVFWQQMKLIDGFHGSSKLPEQ